MHGLPNTPQQMTAQEIQTLGIFLDYLQRHYPITDAMSYSIGEYIAGHFFTQNIFSGRKPVSRVTLSRRVIRTRSA